MGEIGKGVGVLRLGVAAATAGMGAFAVAVAVLAGALSSQAANSAVVSLAETAQASAVSGPVRGLTGEQAANAEVVVSTAMADSAENPLTAQIALMVAYTESRLRDLGPMAGNADSLGLFEQRVSQGWGTTADQMNPAEATAMFVHRLFERAWLAEPASLDGRPGHTTVGVHGRCQLQGQLAPLRRSAGRGVGRRECAERMRAGSGWRGRRRRMGFRPGT